MMPLQTFWVWCSVLGCVRLCLHLSYCGQGSRLAAAQRAPHPRCAAAQGRHLIVGIILHTLPFRVPGSDMVRGMSGVQPLLRAPASFA